MNAATITPKRKEIIQATVVFLFMVLFLYAAFLKLADFETFRAQISKSPLIHPYSSILAWLVPASEILASILLFNPKWRLLGLYLSFTIMFGFTVYIALMMITSPWLPCSCGGIISRMGWTGHLIFNSAFTLLSIYGVGLTEPYSARRLSPSI